MTMCSASDSGSDSNTSTTAIMASSVAKAPDTTIRNPNRRSNKPIMEKRRRARINNCLNELKSILLEAMRKDPARHSKLEKADILELTVQHLKSLHRQHGAINGDSVTRFRQGFTECAAEVGRFLSSPKSDGIDPHTSERLLGHLRECISNQANNNTTNMPHLTSTPSGPGLSPHFGGSPLYHHHQPCHPMDTSSSSMPVISMVPTRLSSGEIAFVLPTSFKQAATPNLPSARRPSPSPPVTVPQGTFHPSQPMMSPEVPLELTVQSTSSASSSTSSTSSQASLSPNYHGGPLSHLGSPMYAHHRQQLSPYSSPYQAVPMSFSPSSQQPMDLVTPKRELMDPDDKSFFRPW